METREDNYYSVVAGILVWHSYWNEYWAYSIYNGYKIFKSLKNRPLHIGVNNEDKYPDSFPTDLSLKEILYLIDHDKTFDPAHNQST